jgi:hypothetical protein
VLPFGLRSMLKPSSLGLTWLSRQLSRMEEDDAATAVRFDGAETDCARACPAVDRMLTTTNAHTRVASPLLIAREPPVSTPHATHVAPRCKAGCRQCEDLQDRFLENLRRFAFLSGGRGILKPMPLKSTSISAKNVHAV